MEDNTPQMPHTLTLNERRKLMLTGAQEVLSFDDASAVLRTGPGNLSIHGRELQLKSLCPDGGQLEVEGVICALIYEEPRKENGLLRRLLG